MLELIFFLSVVAILLATVNSVICNEVGNCNYSTKRTKLFFYKSVRIIAYKLAILTLPFVLVYLLLV